MVLIVNVSKAYAMRPRTQQNDVVQSVKVLRQLRCNFLNMINMMLSSVLGPNQELLRIKNIIQLSRIFQIFQFRLLFYHLHGFTTRSYSPLLANEKGKILVQQEEINHFTLRIF